MAWTPTPPEERFTAEVYDPATGRWTRCEYTNLRKGCIFRSFAPDGRQVHPETGEDVEADVVAIAGNDPIKLDDDLVDREIPQERLGRGYGVMLDRVGTFDEIRKKLS